VAKSGDVRSSETLPALSPGHESSPHCQHVAQSHALVTWVGVGAVAPQAAIEARHRRHALPLVPHRPFGGPAVAVDVLHRDVGAEPVPTSRSAAKQSVSKTATTTLTKS